MNICVYGSADKLSKKCMHCARLLGEYIGKNKHTLVYGGFNDGLLGEVAYKAKEHNADIISIFPDKPRNGYKDFPYSTIVYREKDKRKRKKLQIDNADVFVILPEGLGVLDELFETLLLKQYGQHNKAIFIINIEHRYDLLISLLYEQNCKDLFTVINDNEIDRISEIIDNFD